MAIHVAIPIVAGSVAAGLAALRIRALMLKSKAGGNVGTVPAFSKAPDFKASPPAAAAVPAGRPTAGLPVVTQEQFNAFPSDIQSGIRADALKGILTFTATNGMPFVEKVDAASFGPDGKGFFTAPGLDIRPDVVGVDVIRAKALGTNIPNISGGTTAFQALELVDATRPGFVRMVSRDPRNPGLELMIPTGAIFG